MKRRRQSAVALVTTLIMLSLITFTAVVFLAVTMREKDSVKVSEDMMDAKTLAENALMDAQAQLVALMVSTTNQYIYDYNVSRTFLPSILSNANPFFESDVTNFISQLVYEARPPVYVRTNLTNNNMPWQHRFWLDINRNGMFEPSGDLAEVDAFGALTFATNNYVGDPEWKGVLQYSFPTNYGEEWPRHSRTNKFVGRYAWVVVPYGKSLSLNNIHNYAKRLDPAMAPFSDSFRRNQGFGSYELNLAAFLATLNTNIWAGPNVWSAYLNPGPYYNYYTNLATANSGVAFDDALALLTHRYNTNYGNLASISNYYGTLGAQAFTNDLVDAYVTSPLLMTGTRLPTNDTDNVAMVWPGSVNTNPAAANYFDIFEVFNQGRAYSSMTLPTSNFTHRLLITGTNQSSYDRYTLSRFLSQMGTESSIPPGEKVHLNYDNRVPNSPTDFIGWEATNFFNETANRLLMTNYNISLTDPYYTNRIDIYPTNRYTAGIHRLLQLTANIYDATTNRVQDGYPYYPTVLRPIFTNDNGRVSIVRYDEVTSTNEAFYGYITREEASTNSTYLNQLITANNIWGVPWVVGAKKGFPAFNEFELYSTIQLTRRLEFLKSSTNTPASQFLRQTNQLYTLGVSNMLGAEIWNPYTNDYPRELQIMARLDTFTHLTNQFGAIRSRAFAMFTNATFAAGTYRSNGFFLPFVTNYVFMPDSVYYNSSGLFVPVTNLVGTNVVYERGQQFYIPQWGLSMSNRMFAVIMDTTAVPPRVVDYVNFDSFTFGVDDISRNLINVSAYPDPSGAIANAGLIREIFDTNRVGGTTSNHVTRGVLNQIFISLGRNTLLGQPVSQQDWNNFGLQNQSQMDKQLAIATFQRFMGAPVTSPYQTANPNAPNYVKMPGRTNMQAPFTAVAKMVFTNNWQANDPLVHYTLQDLMDPAGVNLLPMLIRPANGPIVSNNLAIINERYSPWGLQRRAARRSTLLAYDSQPATPITTNSVDYGFNYFVKDPQVNRADDWNFPGQKFANIGWLGRVHRGTPWQTVYLKAGAVDDAEPLYIWSRWSNSGETHPTNDWALPDMFTVATDVSTVTGLLSVNQTNQAAWAAVLGNVLVLSNTVNFNDYLTNTLSTNIPGLVPVAYTNLTIEPVGDQIKAIVDGINTVRTFRTANLGGGLRTTNAFVRMGDILSVPQLSIGSSQAEGSPYLNLTDQNLYYGVDDVALERIPQQILSLLKVDDVPRVVVYAWGQSLKPAPNSVVLSGQYRGIVTNYTVVSEHATRTVLRIEGGPRNPRVVVENFTVLPSD